MLIDALNAVLCCCHLEGRAGNVPNMCVWFTIFLIGNHQWPNTLVVRREIRVRSFLYCDLWCSPQSTFRLSDIAAG
jgi:hypothetical protein